MPRPPLRVWVWTAAACALVLVAVLLWRGSDAAATDSTTSAPPEVPTGEPADDLAEAWAADGEPLVEASRVLLGGERGVTALDVTDGGEAWRYTRANARLCDLTAVDAVVVAVFATADRCDEAISLDVATGARVWTRNVNLRPEVRLTSTDQLVAAVSRTGVVVLDPTGSGTRWRTQLPEGCRILDAAVGDTGVAVLQRCGETGTATLRLLDGFEGSEHWSREVAARPGAAARLAGADGIVVAVVDDRLVVHEAEGGDVLETVDLPPAGDAADEPLHSAPVGSLTLVWARGTLRALDTASGAERWSAPAAGLPAAPEVSQVVPGAADLLVPEESGFVRRDVATGRQVSRLPVEGGPAPGGRVAVVGPVVVLRLADRVVAYR